MRVDEMRLKQAIQAIDEESRRNARYTFDYFCKENDLYRAGVKARADDFFIACPFHKDEDPSLVINESHRTFKCFGCGVSGSYVSFITRYSRECLGVRVSVPQKVNEILKGDAAIQSKVGFTSVFCPTFSLEGLEPMSFHRFKRARLLPVTYLELASCMKRDGVSEEQVRLAVTLMQSGLEPSIIYQQVKGVMATAGGKKYSLKELDEYE